MTVLLTRRRVLTVGAAATAASAWAAPPASAALAYPFTLGVASGEPTPDGVLLWTRLAPAPLTASGGMPAVRVRVYWQVATDSRFARVVRSGSLLTGPSSAHSVHVGVTGLLPDRVYYYRFRVGRHLSRTGRTRTFPAAGAAMASVTFATVSCQALFSGRYAAYRHLASTAPDFVLHLGDYIYEGAGPDSPEIGRDRRHAPYVTVTGLSGYRIRHAQYRLDPDLQDAHATVPFLCVPDDHEVVNDMAGDHGSNGLSSPQAFLPRRAAAYRAYYEHLPLRRSALPNGAAMRTYRRTAYGSLLGLSLLDTRQYRSAQTPGGDPQPPSDAGADPSRTMTGAAQERWLLDGLAASRARWNAIGSQVYIAGVDLTPGETRGYQRDKWAGYPAARARLTHFLQDARPRNPVVLSGDIHAAMVNDVTVDNEPGGAVVATELIGSSISSGKDNNPAFVAALPENPQVRYYNGQQRGYLSCTVTPQEWTANLWFVDDVADAASPVRRLESFVVQDGRPGAQRA
jgi:alkaline phosphatase D